MTDRQQAEVRRRRTFAIISHPDAGKTTLTEKLLLFSGAIQIAGSVKARKAARHATSDWMEIEKQRGISVASSVMQMEYRDCVINLLDTPGHQDFSEDTYRVLTAVDAALMVIDAANGVTNAASLARMYAALVSEVDGVRLLDADTLERAIAPQVSGPSTVPLLDIPFALGFMTHSPLSPLLNGRSFGHYGAGGSLGFADPDRRVAGAYVMNAAQLAIAGDARTLGLLAAVDQVVN